MKLSTFLVDSTDLDQSGGLDQSCFTMFGAFTVNIKRSVILQRIVNVLLCRLFIYWDT